MRDQYDYQGGRVQAFGHKDAAWLRAAPLLPAMEATRKRLFTSLISMFLAVPVLTLLLPRVPGANTYIGIGILLLAVGLIYVFIRYQAYRIEFKNVFSRKIFEAAYPDLNYSPPRSMTLADFHNASLWGRADRIRGEDYFSGKVAGQELRFSEINAERRVRRGKNSHWESAFQGVLVCCSIECVHRGRTVVCAPRSFENLWHSTEIKVQYPGFAQHLEVFSESPVDAANIFTPEVGEMLLHMVKKYGPQFRIALHDSWIYAGFHGVDHFVEPPFATPISKQTFEASFQVIETAASFASDMHRTFNAAVAAGTLKVASANPFSVAIGDDI